VLPAVGSKQWRHRRCETEFRPTGAARSVLAAHGSVRPVAGTAEHESTRSAPLMTSIIEIAVPAEQLALADTLSGVPETRVDVLRTVTTGRTR